MVLGIVEFGFCMHNELSLYEIETVCHCFPGVVDHVLLNLFAQLWHLVDSLHFIGRVGHAEGGTEIIWLYQFSFKIMPFDHPKIFDWLRANSEAKGCTDGSYVEDYGSKVVSNSTSIFSNWFANLFCTLGKLDEDLIVVAVSDFEVSELNSINVGLNWAQKSLRWILQR